MSHELQKRWNAGCQEALQLFRDLQRHGYIGGHATVARDAPRLRQAQGLQPPEQRPGHTLPPVVAGQHKPLTTRWATRLVLKRPRQRTSTATQLLTQLQAQHRELAVASELAAEAVDVWVRQARPSEPAIPARGVTPTTTLLPGVSAAILVTTSFAPVRSDAG
jgi:transposase